MSDPGGLSLETTFLVSIWCESLLYGFFLCLAGAMAHVNLSSRTSQNNHSTAMFYVSIIMWFIATLHVSLNCYRMIQAYTDHNHVEGGAVAFLGNLKPWHHIFKDTLYATQEILGNAVGLYRCFIIWDKKWKIMLVPFGLFIGSVVSGYVVCALFATVDPTATVFDPVLLRWITTFYSLAVIQNVITTTLIAYRLYHADRTFRAHSRGADTTGRSSLTRAARLLVESAALQLLVEIILLALYSQNLNAQYVLLEMVTPIVGITFTALSLRISYRRREEALIRNRTLTSGLEFAIQDGTIIVPERYREREQKGKSKERV